MARLGLIWRIALICLSVGLGSFGFAFALAPGQHPTTEVDAASGSGPKRTTVKSALMTMEERSRWATRVLIDREEQSVIIFRDVIYGMEPREVLEGDARLILDEVELHQVTPIQMELSVGDMQVRLMLQRFGPRENDKTRPKSATEIVIWINGKSRVVGHLEGSWHQACGAPIWDRISIWRKGGVVVGSAVAGEYPIIRRGQTNGDLGTEDGWMIEPADAFPSSEELDRYIESLDDDDAKRAAKPAAVEQRAVVATHESLPFLGAPIARR